MFLDGSRNELVFKLTCFGPALAGKATNLESIFRRTAPQLKTELISHATETERTLSFSFTPNVLPIDGKTVRLSLHAVPGTVHFDASGRAVLEGVDGVIFAADSMAERLEQNLHLMDAFGWSRRGRPERTSSATNGARTGNTARHARHRPEFPRSDRLWSR